MGFFDLNDWFAPSDYKKRRRASRLKEKIAELKSEKTELMQQRDCCLEKICDLVAKIKDLVPKYESAHGADKNRIAWECRALLEALALTDEKKNMIKQHIGYLTFLIQKNDDSDDVICTDPDTVPIATDLCRIEPLIEDKLKAPFADESADVKAFIEQMNALFEFKDEEKQTKDELFNI